jgi:hypothetical protein
VESGNKEVNTEAKWKSGVAWDLEVCLVFKLPPADGLVTVSVVFEEAVGGSVGVLGQVEPGFTGSESSTVELGPDCITAIKLCPLSFPLDAS